MAEKTKKEIKRSPWGVMKFGHLDKPDTRFDEEGKYQLTLILDESDPKTAAWLDPIEGYIKNRKLPNSPIHRDKNKEGKDETTVKFASQFKPRVFGMDGEPLPPGVLAGNGSTVCVAYVSNVYTGFGGGVNLYLQAVQVKVLKEYTGMDAKSYGFEVEEGTTTEPTDDPEYAEDNTRTAEDENLPF